MLDRVRLDVRYALRQMGRAPTLTAIAALVLALGIGTNAAVFAVIDGVLFRPPPGVHDADALVTVRSVPLAPPPSGLFADRLTYEEFLAVREDGAVAAEAAAWTKNANALVALRTSQGDERIAAELVTSAYFHVLRTPMALGTGFQPGNDRPGDPPLHVVLGYAFWQQRMGGATDVVGHTLTLNGYPFTVLGVATERFHGADGDEDPIDVWLPASASPLLFPDQPGLLADGRRFEVVARMPAGAARARTEVAVQAAGLRVPPTTGAVGDEPRRLALAPYRGLGMAGAERIIAAVGGAGVVVGAIILLIACVNVGALLLGRSLARRREIAVRLALGAGRATIVRQLLTESVMLGLLSGVLGIVLATWALDALGARLFTFPVLLSPRSGTLAATIAVAAGTGILFGTFPALHATRAAVFTALKDAVAGADRRTARVRGWFAVAQLALCLPLLAAAGLLVSEVVDSARRVSGVPEPERLLQVSLDLRPGHYTAGGLDALLIEARTRIAGRPDVRAAAFADMTPLAFGFTGRIRLPGADAPSSDAPLQWASLNAVDPEFFGTVGIPIVRGRAIDHTDVAGAPPAVVIGDDVARRLWPGRNPIGQTLTYIRGRAAESVLTVVGVIRAIGPEWNESDGRIALHGSRAQFPDTLSPTLLVRVTGDAAATLPGVRATLHSLDSRLVVTGTATLAGQMRQNRLELAHASAGATGIGVVALLLACIGVYAVVAFGVAERTREIGVRVALGATRASIVRLFVRGGLRMALAGLAIGIPLTYAAVKLLGAGMFGLERFTMSDAGALTVIVLLLVTVAVLSSWIPARRSATIDPVETLRAE